jgi:AraC family transcriptional regulator
MSETHYASSATLRRHSHEYACFVVVLEGTFEDSCGRIDRTVAPGTVILRPAGDPHSNRFSAAGGRCLNVELSPEWLTRVRSHTRALDTSSVFTGPSFGLLGIRLYEELRHDDEASPLAVESIALGLLADADRALRRASVPPPWLLRARDLVHERMSERLTLAGIAAEAGVHPIYLASAFQRFFGESVGAYLRQVRIAYACRKLRESDVPLAEIALAAGFADQSHFGRTFKRVMHATPRQFRASFQAS